MRPLTVRLRSKVRTVEFDHLRRSLQATRGNTLKIKY
jgi:hypothetical protein